MSKDKRDNKTHPLLEEMVKDPNNEAIYVAIEAPNHFKHPMHALQHGKQVTILQTDGSYTEVFGW